MGFSKFEIFGLSDTLALLFPGAGPASFVRALLSRAVPGLRRARGGRKGVCIFGFSDTLAICFGSPARPKNAARLSRFSIVAVREGQQSAACFLKKNEMPRGTRAGGRRYRYCRVCHASAHCVALCVPACRKKAPDRGPAPGAVARSAGDDRTGRVGLGARSFIRSRLA